MRLRLLSFATCIAGFAFARSFFSPGPIAQNAVVTEPVQSPVAAEPASPPPSSPAEKPTRERLREALADKDVFRGAHGALAWVEAATIEDFRAFIKGPKKFPRIYFAGFDDDFQKAFLDAFMERWLTLAPEDTALIEKNESEFRDLLPAAARAMPALVLSKLSPDGKKSPYDAVAATAFEALAARDYRAARRILDTIQNPETKRGYEFAVLKGLAKNDPLAASALLTASTGTSKSDYAPGRTVEDIVEAAERIGLGTLRQLFASAGGKLDTYSGLSRLLLRYPDLADDLAARAGTAKVSQGVYLDDENLIRDADQTPAETRTKILIDYDNLPPAGRDALCAALVAAWARTEPRAAAEWAIVHAKVDDAESPANTAAQYAFIRWVGSDAKAAFAWWQALPPSAMRDKIGMEASTRFAEDGDFETAKTLFRYVPGSRNDALSHFASLYAKKDPMHAAEWLAALPNVQLPPYNQYPNPVPDVVNRYFARDPEGAEQWAESLPEGALREQSIARIAIKTAQTDPAAAAKWIVKIADPKIRTSAAQWIVYPWQAEDRAAARAWVEAQTGLDEKFRAEFLKQ